MTVRMHCWRTGELRFRVARGFKSSVLRRELERFHLEPADQQAKFRAQDCGPSGKVTGSAESIPSD